VLALEIGVAQSVVRGRGAWRGPGLTANVHIPRTHNVDAGVEAGFFDLGVQREEIQELDPAYGPVVRRERAEQQFGWVGLAARYHVTSGGVRPVLSAGVAVYGFNQLERIEERTPDGALVRQGTVEFVDLEYTPGLSLGAGVQWPLAQHLLGTVRLRAHGAFQGGFPVLVLSAGVGYR
jgi:hypothetical protein